MLSAHFLENSTKPAKLSTAALQSLIGYNWSGNIRELKNTIERASILTEDGLIDVHHLPDNIRKGGGDSIASALKERLPLDEQINLMEKEMIIGALKETGGVQVKAAGILGINQRSLWHRIKKHEINVEVFKNLH
jgi:DNA-binding NtrC family response regulator